ncbi:MAG: efflux RND transporter permease subunit [Methylococcales bacterium]
MTFQEKFARIITHNPVKVIGAMLLITAVFGYFVVTSLSLKVVLEEMLPVGRDNVQLVQKFGEQFGGANTTLIVVEKKDGDIYDTEFLDKYKRITEELYFHPDSLRHLVQSLALRKTKQVIGSGGRIQIDPIMWPAVPQTAEEMEFLKAGVKAQYQGMFVSDDEKSMMIIADFKDSTDYEALLDFVDEIKKKEENENTEIYVAGRPILLGTIYKAVDETLLIMGLSVLLVALILFIYFRTLLGVIIPIGTATVATIWGLGAMGVSGYNLDPLLILLPAFIFAIVLSHNVQFMSRVFGRFGEEQTMRDAAEHGLAKVLFPSAAAIVTDAAGFFVLYLVGIPSIQGLAIICTIWLLSIFPALIFSAALLSKLPRPKSFRTKVVVPDFLWNAIHLQRQGPVIISIGIILLCGSAYFAKDLTIGDAKGSPILWPDSRYNQDNDDINKRFTALGTDIMQVYIEGDNEAMLEPLVHHQAEALGRYVYENVDESRPAQGLGPILKGINVVLYEGDPSYEIIPDTKREVAFNIYLFRSKGEPGDFIAYSDADYRIGNITIPVQDHSGPTVKAITGAVNEFLNETEKLPANTKFLSAGGQIGITEAMNDEIKTSSTLVLVVIAVVILVCVLAWYRSLTASLVLIFSLAIANSLTYAFMAIKGIGMSINTLPLTALGIGLGVDYGIYILDRIKEESKAGCSPSKAVGRAMATAGNAVFITALTMILPLIPWLVLSSLRFQAEMGMLLGLVLFFNMLGALFFVPAIILKIRPKSLFPGGTENESINEEPLVAFENKKVSA